MHDLLQQFIEANDTDTPYPSITEREPGMDIGGAYRFQRAFVAAMPGNIAGYKAALTTSRAQAAMGVDKPVIGALFDRGQVKPGTSLAPERRVVVETELGYRLSRDVGAPVSREDLASVIDRCQPMIEIASPNLAGSPNGIDMVAGNSAAYRYIPGTAVPFEEVAVDDVTARLWREDEMLHEFRSDTVMTGQLDALVWLIDQALQSGYALATGMLLMSGSIGPPQPGLPGRYRGEFSGLSEIAFAIE